MPEGRSVKTFSLGNVRESHLRLGKGRQTVRSKKISEGFVKLGKKRWNFSVFVLK
jgi:hypothetical protein